MTLETKLGARPKGWAPLRSALSVAVAATFAVTMIAPTQLAFAGVGGASVLDRSTADSLLIQVGQGGGKGGKGKGGQARRGGGGGGGDGANRVVVRGPHGNKAVIAKGQKNTVVKRTYVNKTYVNKRIVVRPVRGWYRKPYYGNFVAGVALGTVLAVGAVGIAPVAPASNLCWYWSDPAMINGYWDYCY
jgi:hypothetical protein